MVIQTFLFIFNNCVFLENNDIIKPGLYAMEIRNELIALFKLIKLDRVLLKLLEFIIYNNNNITQKEVVM